MAFDSRTDHGERVRSDVEPHPWLRNPHAQTVVASQFRRVPRVERRVERCELPDGDFVDIAWSGPPKGPIAVLLHGLTGGFESRYACGTALRLHALGVRCLQLLFRGAGEEPNRLPRSYHSGDTGDFAWLLDELRRREPGTPLYAVGWSMGGNVLLKHLGEAGADSPLTAGIAASVPFRLRDGAVRMRAGASRIYQARLLVALKAAVRRKFARMDCPVDLKAALAARDFFEFDDRVTAPLNGFRDAEDYYARCSSRGFLSAIRRPALIVHAKDDPFLSPEVVPEASELAPGVRLELSEHGGHVGFLSRGPGMRPAYWLEQRIAEQFRAWLS